MNNSDKAENIKEKAYNICGEYLQGSWKKTPLEDFKVCEVKGGLSSGFMGLFQCSIPHSSSDVTNNRDKETPRQILLRFHNPNIQSNDEIIEETVIFAILSEKKIGPRLHGVFPGGRLEEYIPSRSTDCYDFYDVYISVAKELAKFHCLKMPIKKIPAFEERCYRFLEEFEKYSEENTIFVPNYVSSGDLRTELKWAIKEMHKVSQKVVFSHNDLQGGNVLLLNDHSKKPEKKIILIDYEFAAYNYRTFDIANFLITKCSYFKAAEVPFKFSVDLDKYPSKLEQENFITAYVNQLQEIDTTVKEQEINKIMKELKIMKLAPLLYWLSFSARELINPRNHIPFEETSSLIWDMYQDLKNRILSGKC